MRARRCWLVNIDFIYSQWRKHLYVAIPIHSLSMTTSLRSPPKKNRALASHNPNFDTTNNAFSDCDPLEDRSGCGPGLTCNLDNCAKFHEIGAATGFTTSSDCCEGKISHENTRRIPHGIFGCRMRSCIVGERADHQPCCAL